MSNFLRLFLASAAGPLLAAAATAQTFWLVDSGFPGPGPGTGRQNDPFRTIQDGVDAAQVLPGDTLAVAPGLYDGFDLNGKSLFVRATGPPRAVVVEAATTPAIRIDSGEGPGTRLRGLLVRPRAFTTTAATHGGALVVENAECDVEDCWFEACAATAGGGAIAVRSGGHATLCGTTFTLNTAPRGSALFLDGGGHAIVDDCEFRGNGLPGGQSSTGAVDARDGDLVMRRSWFEDHEAQEGAAAALDGDVVEDCTFVRNRAVGGSARGGALQGSGAVTRATFRGNRARRGGAAHGAFGFADSTFEANRAELEGGALHGPSTARGCLFRANVADGDGGAGHGGVYVECRFEDNVALPRPGSPARGGALFEATALGGRFDQNVAGAAAANQLPSAGGAAARCDLILCVVVASAADEAGALDDCDVERCTIIDCLSRGGGPVVRSSSVASSIHWTNSPTALDASTTFDWSCVEGGAPGAGNQDRDPRLWAPYAGLYELAPDSPCIDAGDPGVQDPDGSRADQGALPYAPGFTPPTQTVCGGKVSSLGTVPALLNGANPRVGQSWTLRVLDALPGSVGLGVWSDAPAIIPLAGGVICVGSANRLPLASIDASGAASFSFTPAPAVVGLRLRVQFVYRDPPHPDGTGVSITNALEAVLLP